MIRSPTIGGNCRYAVPPRLPEWPHAAGLRTDRAAPDRPVHSRPRRGNASSRPIYRRPGDAGAERRQPIAGPRLTRRIRATVVEASHSCSAGSAQRLWHGHHRRPDQRRHSCRSCSAVPQLFSRAAPAGTARLNNCGTRRHPASARQVIPTPARRSGGGTPGAPTSVPQLLRRATVAARARLNDCGTVTTDVPTSAVTRAAVVQRCRSCSVVPLLQGRHD